MPETAAALKSESKPPEPTSWDFVSPLPCDLTVDLPLPGFTLGDLLRLQPKSVIDSHWQVRAEVPLRVNGELIAWVEFEALGEKLAVRVTEVA